MLIDTHCHINLLIKRNFDVPLTEEQLNSAQKIIDSAGNAGVTHIINVGTSIIESVNCIELAKKYKNNFAVVGIHPGDCKPTWKQDLKTISSLVKNKEENKIVAIGECGLDFHYPNINKQQQKDVFKAQIELSLEYNLPLVIHTRQASQETLSVLEEFKKDTIKGVFHCFSEGVDFADHALNELGFLIGIGGAVTYPNNDQLRTVVKHVTIDNVVFETDAPFLPPQTIRGKQNHPREIQTIAQYVADLLALPFDTVAKISTKNATALFNIQI